MVTRLPLGQPQPAPKYPQSTGQGKRDLGLGGLGDWRDFSLEKLTRPFPSER